MKHLLAIAILFTPTAFANPVAQVNQGTQCPSPVCRALGTPTVAQQRFTQQRFAQQGVAQRGFNSNCPVAQQPAQRAVWTQGRGRGQGRNNRGRARGQRRGRCGQGLSQGQGQGWGRGRGAWRGQGFGRGASFQTAGVAAQRQACTPITGQTSLDPRSKRVFLYRRRLQETLEKELYAGDYYAAADEALAGPPRFGNISNAEDHHANLVSAMITYLRGNPVLSHDIPIVVPTTVAEADATCRDIELLVIDVYAGLITDCVDPALLQTLQNIQASNYQHLSVVGG